MWMINETVEEIRGCLQGKKIKIQHIMMDGNQLTYYLANMTIE